MTRPRKELISISDTPYYHIVSRCVRRAFLCGFDNASQRDYEHRRQWIENRIRILSSLFGIDTCAYAVMSNHYHLVVKLAPLQMEALNAQEIIARWTTLFKGPLLVQRQQQGARLSPAEQQTVNDIVEVWRHRLGDIAWFMKCLNEPNAREANKEDKCTRHFWESRYKSQALLSEEALLSCMAYVDLNPVRAKMSETPEASEYTSIKERVTPKFTIEDSIKSTVNTEQSLSNVNFLIKPLLHFDGNTRLEEQSGIPFSLDDYLTLVDWTGRIIQEDKRGFIAHKLPPILDRLSIDRALWIKNSSQFETHYQRQFQKRRRKKLTTK
ncbi:MAG: REP element-mobilizing transposase RayT [Candidatus Endobugula sp.]|jgi:REP element-mobilizing transposase RayT